MGEPSGIGPEVAVAAYHALGGKYGARKLKLVGDPEVFGACGAVPDDALIPTGAKAKRVPGTLNVVSAPAVIEAIEIEDLQYALGVQWHQERFAGMEHEGNGIFDAFVQAC